MITRLNRLQTAALAAFFGLLLVGIALAADEDYHISRSGLQWLDTQVGTGASPEKGQTCRMLYTGWLYENGKKGKKFDSATFRFRPFEFQIGMGKVIEGWDEGVATMKVETGKHSLIVPPNLAMVSEEQGGSFPPTQPCSLKLNCLASTTFTGSLCENNDKFAIGRALPPVEIGDLLAIHDTGARPRDGLQLQRQAPLGRTPLAGGRQRPRDPQGRDHRRLFRDAGLQRPR